MEIGRRQVGAGLVLSGLAAGTAKASEDVEAAVRARLDRFSMLVFTRDTSLVDEFLEPMIFAGSAIAERADSLSAFRALVAKVYASPARVRFGWSSAIVHHEGDVAWLAAEGQAEFVGESGAPSRIPYRLSAVLQRKDGVWRWRQWIGSEPTAD